VDLTLHTIFTVNLFADSTVWLEKIYNDLKQQLNEEVNTIDEWMRFRTLFISIPKIIQFHNST